MYCCAASCVATFEQETTSVRAEVDRGMISQPRRFVDRCDQKDESLAMRLFPNDHATGSRYICKMATTGTQTWCQTTSMVRCRPEHVITRRHSDPHSLAVMNKADVACGKTLVATRQAAALATTRTPKARKGRRDVESRREVTSVLRRAQARAKVAAPVCGDLGGD